MNLDQTRTPPQGHFAPINGLQMYYEVYGEGDPLVLLHGFTNTSRHLQPFISDLAKYFQVIVPDLRGHGHTIDPTNQYTLAQQGLDVFALLDQLEIERFKAIGFSAGGCSLQLMASQQPERLDAVILVSCASYFTEDTTERLLAMVDQDDAYFESIQHYHPQGVSQIRALVNQMPKLVVDYNAQPPDLSKITAPTLIVWGDRDELSPVSMPVEMYRAIPKAYLWIVPNSTHTFLSDNPDKKYVDGFIEFFQHKW